MKTIKKLLIAMIPGFFFSVCVAQDLTVCTSSSYSIPSVTPAGSAATYVWMENGVEIAGAADVSYINTAGKTTAGTYIYTRMAKMPNCNWQASNSFILCVVGMDSAPAITLPANKCSGEDFVFTVPPVAGTKYEWDGGGVAKDNTYTYSSATAGAKTVTVRAVASLGGSNCTSSYSGATVTVYATPTIIVQPEAKQGVCPDNTVDLSILASDATAYQWLKNGVAVTEGSGYDRADYTTAELNSEATYAVIVGNAGACSVTSDEAVVTMKQSGCCNMPGTTGLFTTFNPCAISSMGSEWMLKDDRESDNIQTYKVKLLADGRYWMVQDLKFGKGCDKITFAGSRADKTGIVAAGYYGDCLKNTNGDYLYDWAATLNQSKAHHGGSYRGCTGVGASANNCQGICPDGWHVPTSNEFDQANNIFKGAYNCKNADCWNLTKNWEASFAGLATATGKVNNIGTQGQYWSSSSNSNSNASVMYISSGSVLNPKGIANRNSGLAVRCVRNY
ncbi:MAG: hypothetical protein LBF39_01205 [Prevotellaceae bacterium]|jgi:uncharacterized protein (TIGR02145 family)|nr:hypothetical protein [Prevotellaceae bacterium]